MEEDYFEGTCGMCKEETRVRYKNLYVSGSEGLHVCLACEVEIVEFIRRIQRDVNALHMRRQKYRIRRGVA